MRYYAKSALSKTNIDCKMNIGCDGIEIQLFQELFKKDTGEILYAEDVFNLSEFLHYPVKVVNLPTEHCYLETLLYKNLKLLEESFYIANYFGRNNNEQVMVVVHLRTNYKQLKEYGLWDIMKNRIAELLSKYPFTELVIENVVPFRLNNNSLFLQNGYGYENVEIVHKLREELQTSKIGTVLDTCHVMQTRRFMAGLNDCITYKEFLMESYEMRDFFKKNKDVIKLIHLADKIEDGLGENHGITFIDNERSKCELVNILLQYHFFKYSCPITIEVREQDYLVCNNYKRTLELVQTLNKDIAL